MRHVFALWTVALLLSAGCSSPQAKSTIRPYTAVSAPLPSAEAIPLWQTTGPLRVGVDPYFEPTRQRSVFDADFHARGILPLLVVIHNQGTEPLHLRRSAITLTLPDTTERHPLPVATVVGPPPAKFTQGEDSVDIEGTGLTAAVVATVFVAASLAGQPAEQTQRRSWEARVADYEAKILRNTIVAPNTSIHGFVFFTSPAARGFEDATLSLRVETGTSSGVGVQVPLRSLGRAD